MEFDIETAAAVAGTIAVALGGFVAETLDCYLLDVAHQFVDRIHHRKCQHPSRVRNLHKWPC